MAPRRLLGLLALLFLLVVQEAHCQIQVLKFNCDRWLLKPKVEKEYTLWVVKRAKAQVLIDSITVQNIPDSRKEELEALKKSYNDNVKRLDELIDLTKEQIRKFKISMSPKEISSDQIDEFLVTIKGHHNLSMSEDYKETLENVSSSLDKMETFKNSISNFQPAPAIGAIALVPVAYLLIKAHKDRESKKLDCLKWQRWE